GTIGVNHGVTPNNWLPGTLAGNVAGVAPATAQTQYSADGLTVSWVQNALGATHRTNLAYGDSRFPWAVTGITDPNGIVSTYSYDLAGRLLTVKQSNPSAGVGELTTVSYAYSLVDPPGTTINKILQIDETIVPNDSNLTVTNRRFYDGLGRVVQERQFDVAIDGSSNNVIWQETHYNALGQPTCQILPSGTNTAQFYWHDCASYASTNTSYDVLGRPLIVTSPDGTQNYSLTTGLTTLTFDAKNQMTLSETDPFGRLIKVGEMHEVYDAFASGPFDDDPIHWTRDNVLTEITTLNGEDVLKVDGNVYWGHWGVVRENSYDIEPGETVFLRFQFDDTNFAGRIGLLTDKGGFIGIISHSDDLYADYNIGGSDIPIGSTSISRDAGVWYRAKIDIDTEGRVTWFVWQEDDPHNSDKHFYYTLNTTASRDFYDDANFRFYIQSGSEQNTTTTLYLSDYQKGSLLTTDYQYDILDNLTSVTDVYGNQTTLSYDAVGRKLSMDDPDMGAWSYEYAPAGSLIEQTDANGNSLCFTYDKLGRIDTKEIGSSPCPGNNILASYSYDNATNGIGQLSAVYWGSDPAQNHDTFSYDTLGRMYRQERVIGGRPYTMQTLSYDSLNRPLQVQYPNGEIITMAYDHEGANSLTAGTDALVSDVRYNAMGQLEYIDRVHSWNLDTNFEYSGASGNFRLEEIVNGNTTDNRPDFTYQYDNVGNVITMTTATQSYGTDTQAFTYDSLNRLVTAVANGNVANYTHNYTYDALGNIENFAGVNYGYEDPDHVHAVTDLNGVQKFWYDANGNMVGRIDEDGQFTQLFDQENRLVYVVDHEDHTFSDSFNTKDTNSWLFNSSQVVPHNLPGAGNVIQSSGAGDNTWNGNFRRTDFSIESGESVRLEFQVTGTNTFAHFGLETDGGWGVNGSRFALIANNNVFDVQERVGSDNAVSTRLPLTAQTNTWYVLTLVVDDTNGLALHLYPKDAPDTAAAYYQTSIPFPEGESWRFHHWIYRDIAYIDNYSEQPFTGFSYDASGMRLTQTWGESVKYTPFPGYEEEVRQPVSAGTMAAAPLNGGPTAFAGPVAPIKQQTEELASSATTVDFIKFALPLILLAGLSMLYLAELSRWYWRNKRRNQTLSRGALASLFLLLLVAGWIKWTQQVVALEVETTNVNALDEEEISAAVAPGQILDKGQSMALQSGFPTTGVLDDFNRANGPIGSSWSGDTGGYTINNSRLDVGYDEDIYWNSTSYATDQEVFITLRTVDNSGTEIGLILKAQSNSGYSSGLIDLVYDPVNDRVQV
ncbi:MAG: hypothetical protein WAS33_28410, partial [Candidatus Promineifilaceae bacterium]